ncbi:MAG: hypothetical protein WDM96_14805 [Lacunisphaera sp.]
MRRFLLTCLGLFAAACACGAADSRPATPEEVALFKDAIKNSSQDTEHWAYTETTTVQTNKGKPEGDTVVRFDPSKPYAEQFTPLQIEGKLPTERQLKKYRRQGEERGRDRARKAERRGSVEGGGPQLVINDSKARLDLEHPRVMAEEPDRITFEAPLVTQDRDLPVDKFQILAEVDRTARQIKRAHFRILQAFRMKVIAKIKSGDATLDFAVVDPGFGPVITSMRGDFGASFMLIPVKATFTNTRTDWQRVKPFDERFNVKLDPLQFPGF